MFQVMGLSWKGNIADRAIAAAGVPFLRDLESLLLLFSLEHHALNGE